MVKITLQIKKIKHFKRQNNSAKLRSTLRKKYLKNGWNPVGETANGSEEICWND